MNGGFLILYYFSYDVLPKNWLQILALFVEHNLSFINGMAYNSFSCR